jgi:hypothetical protein
MNKMKKYFYLLALSATMFSCKKSELNLEPFNQIATSSAFNTQPDVTLAINGMYNGLRTNNYVNGTWNIIADVLSDNVIVSSLGRQSLVPFHEWRYNGDNTLAFFQTGYIMTRRANAILENIDNFPAGTFKDNAKGEALALRAMVYLDMVRIYSKTFENATNTDSTLSYVTTSDANILPSKEPVRGFYTKIIADLTTALPLINASNGVGRLNKAAVNGLLSRAYLYTGDFANCITASTAALGATPVLPSIADFPRIWTDETNNGVLFKVLNTTLDNVNAQGVNYFQIVGGFVRSEYVVEYSFRQLFTPTDVRTNTYIQTSPFNGVNQNHIVKYRSKVSGGVAGVAGVVDAKLLRTAEVLLNRAEAYQRSNPSNTAAALADLNLLKRNRYTGFVDIVGLSGTALLDEILAERRLELAFESDRFLDLKRRNLPVTRNRNFGDRADGTGVKYLFFDLANNDYRMLLPYPSSEINFNTNFKQNPGPY